MDEPLSTHTPPVTSSAATRKMQTGVSPLSRLPQSDIPPLTDAAAVSQLTLDQRIALASLTSGLGEQEADRLWQRYGIMLTLNAGLVAIASFTLSNNMDVFTVGIAVFGLMLTFVWYRIVSLSQFYEERWRMDLAAIIDGDDVLATLLRARSKFGARCKKPVRGSSTDHAKAIVIFAALFWIALTIYFVAYRQPPLAPVRNSAPATSTQ
jgi:hypothetical protein